MVGHNYNIGLRHLLATDVGNFYSCNSTIVIQQSKATMLAFSAVPKDGFPLSRNFYVGTRVNKVVAMGQRSRVNVKVERGSTFTFTRDLRYVSSVLFMRVPT